MGVMVSWSHGVMGLEVMGLAQQLSNIFSDNNHSMATKQTNRASKISIIQDELNIIADESGIITHVLYVY